MEQNLKGELLLLSRISRVRLCATPQTAAHQAPPDPGILQARVLEWVAIAFSLKVRLPVKFTFTPCWSTWVPPHQGPEPQRRAGLLTCAAVVKLQRALDAEGLLAGATAVPVLAVNLVGGRGGASSSGAAETPCPQGSHSSNALRLTAPPSATLPPDLRHTNHAWLTHCPGKRGVQVAVMPTLAPAPPRPGSPPGSLSPRPPPGTLGRRRSAFLRHPPRSCCACMRRVASGSPCG